MTAPDIPSIRYAAPTAGDKLGHLLPRSWPETKRKGRPAACGKWRTYWRPVERMDDPSVFRPCPDCSTAAGIVQAPLAAPTLLARRVAPSPITVPAAAVVPVLLNTQAARTERRARFRTQPCPAAI